VNENYPGCNSAVWELTKRYPGKGGNWPVTFISAIELTNWSMPVHPSFATGPGRMKKDGDAFPKDRTGVRRKQKTGNKRAFNFY
jgi:hypothetical protein